MKVKDCMTKHVISVGTQEPVSVAARLMSRYNLGILPVQTPDGRLCGAGDRPGRRPPLRRGREGRRGCTGARNYVNRRPGRRGLRTIPRAQRG